MAGLGFADQRATPPEYVSGGAKERSI